MAEKVPKASCITDQEGNILYSHSSNLLIWPASITKLATAIVFIREGNLEQKVRISKQAAAQCRHKYFALPAGEVVDGLFLLKAMLIQSCNEAAWAAAESLNYKSFITKMNALAQELGMQNTNFVNPTGLPHDQHYSTAYDLTRLGLVLRQYPVILKAISTKRTMVDSATQRYRLKNTNPLLGKNPYVIGGKTGTTFRNGRGLLLLANKDAKDYVLVTLGHSTKASLIETMEKLLAKT